MADRKFCHKCKREATSKCKKSSSHKLADWKAKGTGEDAAELARQQLRRLGRQVEALLADWDRQLSKQMGLSSQNLQFLTLPLTVTLRCEAEPGGALLSDTVRLDEQPALRLALYAMRARLSAQPSAPPLLSTQPLISAQPSAPPLLSTQPLISAQPSASPLLSTQPLISAQPSASPLLSTQPLISAQPSASPLLSTQPLISAQPSAPPLLSAQPCAPPLLSTQPSTPPLLSTPPTQPLISTLPSAQPSTQLSTKPSTQPLLSSPPLISAQPSTQPLGSTRKHATKPSSEDKPDGILNVLDISDRDAEFNKEEKKAILKMRPGTVFRLRGLRCDLDPLFAVELLTRHSAYLEEVQVRQVQRYHLAALQRMPRLRQLDLWHSAELDLPIPDVKTCPNGLLLAARDLRALTVGGLPWQVTTALLRGSSRSVQSLRLSAGRARVLREALAMPRLQRLDLKVASPLKEDDDEDDQVGTGQRSGITWLQVQGLPRGPLLGLLVSCAGSLQELRLMLGTPPAPGQPEVWPFSCRDLAGLLREARLCKLRRLSLLRSEQAYEHYHDRCALQVAELRKLGGQLSVKCASC